MHQEKSSGLASTSLLPELAQYLQWSGLYEPLEKIYVPMRTVDLPYIAHFLLLFIVSSLPKFAYSRQLAGLVGRRAQDCADGAPFVIGLATLLRHLGASTIQSSCCLLIQFARSHLEYGARYLLRRLCNSTEAHIDSLTLFIDFTATRRAFMRCQRKRRARLCSSNSGRSMASSTARS